jgi:hypothetical protein
VWLFVKGMQGCVCLLGKGLLNCVGQGGLGGREGKLSLLLSLLAERILPQGCLASLVHAVLIPIRLITFYDSI